MASSHYVSCQLHVSVQAPIRSLKFKLFKTKLISICMAIHPAKSLLIIFLSLNYTVEQVIDYKPRVHLQFNPTNLTRRLSPESIHFSSFPTVAISFEVTVISCLELPLNLSICFYLYWSAIPTATRVIHLKCKSDSLLLMDNFSGLPGWDRASCAAHRTLDKCMPIYLSSPIELQPLSQACTSRNTNPAIPFALVGSNPPTPLHSYLSFKIPLKHHLQP